MSISRIIFSGNCYWCVEALFQKINGCISVKPGFFHFKPSENPLLYGRVEAVEVLFDTEMISFNEVLDVFFTTHNPYLVDWSPQECIFPLNRSSIIFNDESHQEQASFYISQLKSPDLAPIHTKILNETCGEFLVLGEDKWNFYINNPTDGYCLSIINPKIKKLQMNLSHLMIDNK